MHLLGCKAPAALALLSHDSRDQLDETLDAKEHIDRSLTRLNYNLGPNHGCTEYTFLQRQIADIKFGAKTNVCGSIVITRPRDLDATREREFFEASYKMIEKRVGKANIISAWVHYDEPNALPHMHVKFVPRCKKAVMTNDKTKPLLWTEKDEEKDPSHVAGMPKKDKNGYIRYKRIPKLDEHGNVIMRTTLNMDAHFSREYLKEFHPEMEAYLCAELGLDHVGIKLDIDDERERARAELSKLGSTEFRRATAELGRLSEETTAAERAAIAAMEREQVANNRAFAAAMAADKEQRRLERLRQAAQSTQQQCSEAIVKKTEERCKTEREKVTKDPVLSTAPAARKDLNNELDKHVEDVARVAQTSAGDALRQHYNWLARWRAMVERWRTRLTQRRAEMAAGLTTRRVRAHARLAEASRGKTSQARSVLREVCELLQVEHWRPLNDRLTAAELAVERMPIGAQYDHMTRQLARLNEAAGMLCRQGLWSWSAIRERQAELRAAVTIASAKLHDRRLDADERADLEYVLKLAERGLRDLDVAVARERWCDAMVARLAGEHLTAEQHAALEVDIVDLPGYIDRASELTGDELDDIYDIVGDDAIAMEMRRQSLTAAAGALNENGKTQQNWRTKGAR